MSLKTVKEAKAGAFAIVEKQTLQLTDIVANSNKYYTVELREYTDKSWGLYSVYGRTGATKTEDYRYGTEGQCRTEFSRLIRNKEGKGYSKVETEDTVINGAKTMATEPAKTVNINKGVEGPVEWFVNYIYGFSRDFVKEAVDLPIGKLSLGQINLAQSLLKKIEQEMLGRQKKVTDDVIELHNQYYKAVPQRLGHKIDINSVLLKTDKDIASQEDLLQQIKDMVVVKESDTDFEKRYKGLNAEISVPTKAEIDRIKHYVLNSRSSHHGIKSIEIKDILAISRKVDDDRYDEKLAKLCEQEVFHGTKNVNLLGICSRGLMLPGQHSASITGAMFGPGIYGAIHSTKSMQYCGSGGYNDRHSSRSSDQFMFIMQMGMGNWQSGGDWRRHYKLAPGKHSTWAKAKEEGLLHDELIVYNTSQVKLTHIVRFQTQGSFY